MALTVETGTGIASAEAYVSVADADTYFGNRTHLAAYTTWTAATTAVKEGCLREAADYLDAVWGDFYKGDRAGRVQGLLWPRTEAFDSAGYNLPALPQELINANCELAGRAAVTPLAPDLAFGNAFKQIKAGSVQLTLRDGAPGQTTYGVVAMALAPILNGMQPGGNKLGWSFL